MSWKFGQKIIDILRNKSKCESNFKIDKGNIINITKSDKISMKLNITGVNNSITVKEPANYMNLSIHIVGNNNNVFIDEGCFGNFCIEIWGENRIENCNNCNVKIGNDSYIGYNSRIFLFETNTQCEIGNHCRISDNVYICCSDIHSVIDLKTGCTLNRAQNIIIGNHVWVGHNVTFNKNTKISDNSIVAHSSIVTKRFNKNNILIAGSPAKIVKDNISWVLDSPSRRLK